MGVSCHRALTTYFRPLYSQPARLACAPQVLKSELSVDSAETDDWKYRSVHRDFFPAVSNHARPLVLASKLTINFL